MKSLSQVPAKPASGCCSPLSIGFRQQLIAAEAVEKQIGLRHKLAVDPSKLQPVKTECEAGYMFAAEVKIP
jgi:hypothetical protein